MVNGVGALAPSDGPSREPDIEDPRGTPFFQGASTFSVKILAYASGAAVSILVARALGPQERGIWSLALSLASLIAMAGDVGLSTSALYLMRSHPTRIRPVVSMGLALAVGGSVAMSAIVLAGRNLGSGWLSGMPPSVLTIVGLVIPLLALLGLFRQLLTALGDLTGANASLVAQSVLMPVVLVTALLAGPRVAQSALWGYLGVLAATALVTAGRLWPRIPGGPLWDASLLGPLVGFGFVSQIASLALVVTYRSDLLLVGHWLGLTSAGVYSVGLTLSEILRGVPETAQALVVSRSLREDLASYTADAARKTVLLTAAAGLLFIMAAPVAVPLVFGRSFAGASVVLTCLVPGVVGLAVSYAISPLLFLEGRVGVSAIAGAVAAIVLWAASVLTPFPVSLPKVALASSLAYWTLAGIQVGYLAYHGRIELRALVPRRADAAALVAALNLRRRY